MKYRIPFPIAVIALMVFEVLSATSAGAQGPPVQIHLDHWRNGGTVQTAHKWADGNLHSTNSTYTEGDFIPTRFVLDNLPPGDYSLRFRWLAAKSQGGVLKHAHDYLSTFNKYAASPYGPFPGGANINDFPCLPRVQGGGNGPDVCSGAPDTETIPPDTIGLNGANDKPWEWDGLANTPPGAEGGPADFSMWNATITGISMAPYYEYTAAGGSPYDPSTNPAPTATAYNEITVFFTVGEVPSGQGVVLALGARLAVDDEWNDNPPHPINGDGACSINGAPYHWSYELNRYEAGQPPEKLQSGNRDRSIMCEGERVKFSLSLVKACYIGTTLYEDDQPFNFEGSASFTPNPFDPSTFEVNCSQFSSGGSMWTFTKAGTYSLKELADQLGWELREISCVDTGTTNPADATYTGAMGGSTDFELGDDTANVTFSGGGGDVTCTFSNYRAEMPLRKLVDGKFATCTDPGTGQPTDTDPFDAGERPCTYDVGSGLTLEDNSDPRFTFDLYFRDTPGPDPGDIDGFPSPAVASALVPPLFEAPGLIGVPLTLCEEPVDHYVLTGVTVVITGGAEAGTYTDTDGSDWLGPLYHLETTGDASGVLLLPPFAHSFPAGSYTCFDILLPSETTKFEIQPNNLPTITLTKQCQPSDDEGTFDLQINGDTVLEGAQCGDSSDPVPVSFEEITVGESSEALDDYQPEVSCSPVDVSEDPVFEDGTVSWNLDLSNLDPDQAETCTITNRRKPTITLSKVCVPSDGTSTFTLHIGDEEYPGSMCGDTQGPVVVDFDVITVGESDADPPLSDWISNISCSPVAAGEATTGENSISWDVDLTNAEPATEETCTVTNIRIFCSFTQGAWFQPPNGGNPANVYLDPNFSSVWPGGLFVGTPLHHEFTVPEAVEATAPGGTSAQLTASDMNYCGTDPGVNPNGNGACHLLSGNLGSQTTALKINVELGNAGAFAPYPGIGGLVLGGLGGADACFNGYTVEEFLAIAEAVLGGQDVSTVVCHGGGTFGGSLGDIVGLMGDGLNPSFDQCKPSDWALGHLVGQ